jgi:chemotaxis protein MotB
LNGILSSGCNQNPYLAAQSPQAYPQSPNPALAAQQQELDRRANALDADNRDLHSELARVQQERQLLEDELGLLRERLNETAGQLRDALAANQEVQRKVQAVEASTRRRGSATITANNSVRDALEVANIPGFDVRQDGDVVRIEVPSDRLFQPRTAQLLPAATYLIDELTDSISRNYPRQMIGIEGHTDNSSAGATTNHQLAASQAMAVFAAVTRRSQIPPRQLFVVAYGENHPTVSNGTPSGRSKNRRIEFVVYPETARPR